jgi:thiosulfate dehydrogenase [quinone] large subunit
MNPTTYAKTQVLWLTILRVVIGWHFLYEGAVKLANPNWTSAGYLLDSQGFLRNFYYWLASDPAILGAVDFLNVWGLVAIGIGLVLGLFTRVALWGGIVLLVFYYFSHPPFIGLSYSLPMEGSYLIVNKTLIELIAMVVLLQFAAVRFIGIDNLMFGKARSF